MKCVYEARLTGMRCPVRAAVNDSGRRPTIHAHGGDFEIVIAATREIIDRPLTGTRFLRSFSLSREHVTPVRRRGRERF